MRDTLGELDATTHNKAIVCATAVLGEEGFEFTSRDNMHELDAEAAITILLEGYAMVSASGLVALIEQATRECRAAKDLPEDRRERVAELRTRVEAAVRHWLQSVMRYAGERYQQNDAKQAGGNIGPDDVVVAASQVMGLWMGVAAGDVALGSKTLDAELKELRGLKDAYERSGLDVSPCLKCEKDVVCLPDGMPICDDCADQEAAG